jgi:heavy metal translocating P-type ATPase
MFMTSGRISSIIIVLAIVSGFVAQWATRPEIATAAWILATVVALAPLLVSILRALKQKTAGVDIIALLAMAGALAMGEYLAGAVIALMLAGGNALEEFASGRARRELEALVGRAPRLANLCVGDEGSELMKPVPVDEVVPGNLLMVKPGEVVPVDGVVSGATAVLDESTLTGESMPVERRDAEPVCSGTVNASGAPFRMRATAVASGSTYAGIVRLVEQAQAAKAPLARLADRYALFFLPFTILVAATAWVLSGDPRRGLAVLVVATPCPLILAAPVALIAGISRAARRGIIIKGGGALETLGRGKILILDKTGTVTGGAPVVTGIEVFGEKSADELLLLAASLDQVSPHVFARPLIEAAREHGLALVFPSEVDEEAGAGIKGRVNGHDVAVGRPGWVTAGERSAPAMFRKVQRRSMLQGSSIVAVAVDGKFAGAFIIEDPVRGDAPATLRRLRLAGFRSIYLLTGDHEDVARVVGAAVGVDKVFAERSPEEKVAAVVEGGLQGITVMVGDGINDAPALAAASVGVAMGARGATASSEAADVVITVDRLDRLAEAVHIAVRSRRVALESIFLGMGLSIAGMALAALAFITPVQGALIQEVIDALAILNALRALTPGRTRGGRVPDGNGVGHQIREEHRKLVPGLRRIRQLADELDVLPPARARAELQAVRLFLVNEILPHNEAEDATLYPAVARLIGGNDPTGPMTREHAEIAHLANLFARTVDDLPEAVAERYGSGITVMDHEDVRELRRMLYGLSAILKLHLAQEEESYLTLFEAEPPVGAGKN